MNPLTAAQERAREAVSKAIIGPEPGETLISWDTIDDMTRTIWNLALEAAESNECWNWQGHVTKAGYGRRKVNGKNLNVHRTVYEALIGPVDKELHLDHLCRNRKCANPFHLEPVTPRENILRGVGPTAKNAKKDACVNGHPFDSENTRFYPNGRGRECKACKVDVNKRIEARVTSQALSKLKQL